MKPLLLFILLLPALSLAQEKKEILIERMNEKVKVDGVLNEKFWNECKIITGFTQNTPKTGEAASKKTEVRIAYDDNAIYVGAIMYDDIDSMSLTLSQRDNEGNADWFGVIFDPYNAGTIGYSFVVTSAGVQKDVLEQQNSSDNNWNAVWQSAVEVRKDKWVAELKIPFSAIRFSKKNLGKWGINFVRNIRRFREQSHWNFFDPNGANYLSQLGVMKGIKDVDSPLRLSFTPYVSGYIENYNGSTGYTANGGMDVKYGINDAFTLDMTLIPDFGQVQFDNQVLNLSPFEVRFNERRQFFTEGTELFNKAGLFYSRRIGGTPINFSQVYSELQSGEIVEENPSTTQLLNATKVSGRTKTGTGIGIFNAISGEEFATVRDTVSTETRKVRTSPLTNYSVFVLDQNLKNNSTVTLTNTNVLRDGHTYDANVTGLNANIFTKGQRFNLNTSGSVTQKYFPTDSVALGHAFVVGASKSSGQLRYGVSYNESSKTYDRNDLGFQTTNNLRSGSFWLDYNIFTPFWRLLRLWSGFGTNYTALVEPSRFSSYNVNFNIGGTFRNFMTMGINFGSAPFRNHNWFEPRVEGRFYENDENFYAGYFMSSDYSKPFAFDGGVDYWVANDSGRYSLGLRASPRIRMNDMIMLILNSSVNYSQNEEGVAVGNNGIPFDPDNPEDPIFAKRNRLTVTNTINWEFIFTNKMGITFRLRHYWSKVEYREFFVLNDDGGFDPTTYTGYDADDNSYHDNSFNAFTIDAVYRWVFAPGSELSFVWKNSIFSSSDEVELDYFQNVDAMFQNPATNSLSLKILYYIDYWSLHQKIFNRKDKLKE